MALGKQIGSDGPKSILSEWVSFAWYPASEQLHRVKHFVLIPTEMLRVRSAPKLLYLFFFSGPHNKAVRNTTGILGSRESGFNLSIHSMFGR